jgi:outer membrane receptor for ferrienterochelin and colicins
MKHRANLCTLISCLAFMNGAFADAQLNTQQVTGHQSVYGSLNDTPVRVEVISQLFIEENHASNLAEALQYSPGIQLKPLTGKSGVGVWLQGYDANQVAILIDGNPVAAGTGSSTDVSQIALGNVERIEISKGSMSAIYGSSAMGGVINVITKAPSQGGQANFNYSGGSWGDQDLPYDSAPLGKQHVQASVSKTFADNYVQLLSDNQVSSGYRAPNSDGSQGWQGYKSNVSMTSRIQLYKDTSLTVSPRLYKEDIKTFKDNFISGNGNILKDKIDLTEKKYLSAVINHRTLKGNEVKLNTFFEDYKNESRQDLQKTAHIEQKRNTNVKNSGIIFNHKSISKEYNQIIFGAELLSNSMNVTQIKDDNSGVLETSTEVDNKKINNRNLFFQSSWQVTPEFEWLLSGRSNHNDKYGSKFSPMLNLQYRPFGWLPGDLNFRFGAGHGYRTPNLKELYYIFDHSHLGYMVFGNENLIPESSVNFQTSIEWKANSANSFDMSIYYNTIKNLIDTFEEKSKSQELNLENGANFYGNIARAKTYGTEFSYTRKVTNWLSSHISYAYLHAENTQTGNQLTSRPEHDVKTSLDFFITYKSKLSVKYKYASKQYSDINNENITPAYSQIDIKFNYAWSDDFTFFTGIDNLTDTQKDYQIDGDLRPDAGRYAYAGFKLNNLNF